MRRTRPTLGLFALARGVVATAREKCVKPGFNHKFKDQNVSGGSCRRMSPTYHRHGRVEAESLPRAGPDGLTLTRSDAARSIRYSNS
jgi:hypothetical protein